MKIIKHGTTVKFDCFACGCIFYAGIHVAEGIDGNYYCNCPECGSECHANVSAVSSNGYNGYIQKKEDNNGQ